MNRLAEILVSIVLMLGCASFVYGQEGGEGKKKRGYQHQEDIVTEYNSKKDETKVELQRMAVRVVMDARTHDLRMSIYYTYPGRTPTKPSSIAVIFVSSAYDRERRFQEVRDFSAQLDSEKISFGTAELLESRILTTYYKEVVGIVVPFDQFFQLVDNKKETLEMRVGNTKFHLLRPHMEALRDLASRINK